MKTFWKKYRVRGSILLLVMIGYYFCLPSVLFDEPYSSIIESREGKLLGGKIATDGQWRFPQIQEVPYKFEKAILQYEDKHFYQHFGVNPVSVAKALYQNIKAGKIVRGGSTITQQVIRMSRKGQKRTYWEKIIEMIQATRLEFRYPKHKILALYASYAPFGGNVVGIDMASWRYFGVSPEQLSWAESALLAVLPNAPGLIHLGKNQQKLKQKRNRLLYQLLLSGEIDKQTYELSLLEPLPEVLYNLPQHAPHLTEKIAKENPQKRVKTTIDYYLQQRVNQIVNQYYQQYKQFDVYNMAVLVVDIRSREVLTYVGNTPTDAQHKKDVNIIHAPRSTGSVLKPLLYAAMLDSGELLPQEFVPDIPTQISEYTPENFDNTFEGIVPADWALAKSLNIPYVLMLQQYGVYRFYDQLQKHQLNDIKKAPNHYGLSLILGGAESNLWDLSQAYTNMADVLLYFNQKGMYREFPFQKLTLTPQTFDFGEDLPYKNHLGAASIWQTFEAMTQVNRPSDDVAWAYYNSSQRIAWKTGTSFGNRDAWAIGLTSGYLVGVWVGNATGEGRPQLTGGSKASPILFEVFGVLPKSDWFEKPTDDLEQVRVCQVSGCLASEICPSKNISVVANVPRGAPCPYHKLIHLSADKKFQVNTNCESTENIVTETRLVLPPIMGWYYKKKHLHYQFLPPFKEGCFEQKQQMLDFIYPKHNSILKQTYTFGTQIQPIIAKVAYSAKGSLFWYLGDTYLGETIHYHQMPIHAPSGEYLLKVVDTQGNEKAIMITIL